MSTKTDLITNALTGIRFQIIAYHQMRTQAIVFNSGVAVAAAGFTLSNHNNPGMVWIALIGPNTFLMLAFFLAVHFRRLLVCSRGIEAALLEELKKALETDAMETPLRPNSAVYYSEILRKEIDLKTGRRTKMHLLVNDAPQQAIVIYILIYLVFWFLWFKPSIPNWVLNLGLT